MHNGKEQDDVQLHLRFMQPQVQMLRMSAFSQKERPVACLLL
jgi:hypothetical protein